MSNKKEEKRGEINGMSYGKIMTSLLIPKDSRSNPKRILSGIAFIAFISFFLIGALTRSCDKDAVQELENNRTSQHSTLTESRSA